MFILEDENEPKGALTRSAHKFDVLSSPPLVVEWSSYSLAAWSRAYGDPTRTPDVQLDDAGPLTGGGCCC